jgi:hypothetical protein
LLDRIALLPKDGPVAAGQADQLNEVLETERDLAQLVRQQLPVPPGSPDEGEGTS